MPLPSDLPPEHPLALLDASSEAALDAAYDIMRRSYCERISTLHLLLGLLADDTSEASEALRQNGIEAENLKTQALAAVTNDGELATSDKRFTPGARRALERAKIEARKRGHTAIGALHLLLGLLPYNLSGGEKKVMVEVTPAFSHLSSLQLETLATIGLTRDQLLYSEKTPLLPAVGAFFIAAFSLMGRTYFDAPSNPHPSQVSFCVLIFLINLFGCIIGRLVVNFLSHRPAIKMMWMLAICGVFMGTLAGEVGLDVLIALHSHEVVPLLR